MEAHDGAYLAAPQWAEAINAMKRIKFGGERQAESSRGRMAKAPAREAFGQLPAI